MAEQKEPAWISFPRAIGEDPKEFWTRHFPEAFERFGYVPEELVLEFVRGAFEQTSGDGAEETK